MASVVHKRYSAWQGLVHQSLEELDASVVECLTRDRGFMGLFVWFDSLRPINNLSVIKARVFLGWTSTKLGLMFLFKDTTQCHRWGSNPRPLGLVSSSLPLSHYAPLVYGFEPHLRPCVVSLSKTPYSLLREDPSWHDWKKCWLGHKESNQQTNKSLFILQTSINTICVLISALCPLFPKFIPFFENSSNPGPEVIKLFSCSTQLSMKFIVLINVKCQQ